MKLNAVLSSAGARGRKLPPLQYFFSPYQEFPSLQSLTADEEVALVRGAGFKGSHDGAKA